MTLMYVNDAVENEILNWNEIKQNYKKEICNDLNDNKRRNCNNYIDSIDDVMVIKSENVNQRFAKIPRTTKNLFCILEATPKTIDFNNLNSKMMVSLLHSDGSSSKSLDIKQLLSNFREKIAKSSYDRSVKSNIKLAQLFDTTKQKQSLTNTVYIKGDMYNKVSFLTISGLTVSFDDSTKCKNLLLSDVKLSDDTSAILADNLIIESNTYNNYNYGAKRSLINAKRFIIHKYNDKSKTQIIPKEYDDGEDDDDDNKNPFGEESKLGELIFLAFGALEGLFALILLIVLIVIIVNVVKAIKECRRER